MRFDPCGVVCECGRHVRVLGTDGAFTCDSPHCANRGKVFRLKEPRVVEVNGTSTAYAIPETAETAGPAKRDTLKA